MKNEFDQQHSYRESSAVTPSDANDIRLTRGLYTGSGGNITVDMNNKTVLFASTATGVVLPIRVTRVWSTGTAATGILALY